MTQRERNIAIGLGATLAIGAFVIVGAKFYSAIAEHDSTIETLTRELEAGDVQIKTVTDTRPQVNQWKVMSLPADINTATLVYRQFLEELIRRHGLYVELFPDQQTPTKSTIVHPTKPGKVPLYTGLNFRFRARAPMKNVVLFMEDFQKTPMMHRIKKLTIERQESAKKLERELVTVSVDIEALIILDAEKEKVKLANRDVKKEPRFVASEIVETVGRLRGSMGGGLALMGWSLGPWGMYLTPLNPPLKPQRNYEDIVQPGVIVGNEGPLPPPPGSTQPPADIVVNRMRFDRFIGLTEETISSDTKVRPQAILWDMSTNLPLRIRSSNGFNMIPLVQTGPVPERNKLQNVLLRGKVTKIVDRKIIFRIGLNSSDPKMNTNWWRYPDNDFFYKLHPLDRKKIAGQLNYTTLENLWVMGADSWAERLKDPTYRRFKYDAKNKSFQVAADGSRGYVYYQDKDVVVVGFNGWTSQVARDPGVAGDRIYPVWDKIYAISNEHFDTLMADSKVQAKQKKAITPDDIDRIYVFHADYWEWLLGDRLITTESNGSTFYMYHQLIRGDVLSRKDNMVVVRLPEKFCHCFGDEGRKLTQKWHEGYCVLEMGEFVQDAVLYGAVDEKDLPTVSEGGKK